MRINKYLMQYEIGARRKIDNLISEKRVSVNGKIAELGQDVTDSDIILIDGIAVKKDVIKKVYYIFNKPKNVICSSTDPRGRKTVLDVLKVKERVFSIGRLDYDTEGLLIFTNDGDIFNKMIHPKSKVEKTYKVEINSPITKKEIEKIEKGVMIDDEKTFPAKVELIDHHKNPKIFRLKITQGRNRQVKKMMKAIGKIVVELKREKIGNLDLGDLKTGEYCKISRKKIESFVFGVGRK